ncbi:DUF485 domain-containing protein [Selenihalanaerobacter shriftii]|uniref:Uncharacterized membrane protein, DUF485 family n=1 Tax=Selenihalanaerobacter shriftii TaxID=142842 RepID=A0A1T4JQ10_9FIRM|nr:DUF485 domain-containing protein [Selenihalanaerobacter shriftii]SJZ32266.1 Uncharacterized membrane protein, DUF485 family [Selenihalanaerobacter shriftii]
MANSEKNDMYGKVITKDDLEERPKVDKLIKKQWNLSFSLSFIVLFISFMIPVLNKYAPSFMATKVLGFNLYYFVTAFAIYPFVWAITIYYTKKSIRMEKEELVEVLERGKDLEEGL